MLHSIISLSDIFYSEADIPARPSYVNIAGGIAELDGDKIRRLISTDPRMYLDKAYAPGSVFRRNCSDKNGDNAK